MRDGQFDESRRQGLELLTIGNGRRQRRGILRRNSLTDIGPLPPDLMLKVRAGFGTGGLIAEFGFEAAGFHRIQSRHFFEESGALSVKCSIHFHYYV